MLIVKISCVSVNCYFFNTGVLQKLKNVEHINDFQNFLQLSLHLHG